MVFRAISRVSFFKRDKKTTVHNFLKITKQYKKGHFGTVSKTLLFCNLKWKKTNIKLQLKK